MILDALAAPARLKIVLLVLAASVAAVAALLAWGYSERAGRFQCEARLSTSEAQVAVLGATVEAQTASIDRLGQELRAARGDIHKALGAVNAGHAGTQATIEKLKKQLEGGSAGKDCRDALKEWRAGS